MFLAKLHIKNFKLLKETTIHFNESLNILTGANNSGKTTILEAISLWETCFYQLLNQTDRPIYKNKKLIANVGDFKLGYVINTDWNEAKVGETYVAGKDIISVRTSSAGDVHYFGAVNEKILLEATISHQNEDMLLAFEITATKGGPYKISFRDAKSYNYLAFNTFFRRLPTPIQVTYASPIASIQAVEEFTTFPKIKEKVNARESVMVIRNRLYLLFHDKRGLWNDFLDNLSYIVNNRDTKIEIDFEGCNVNEDIQIRCKIKTYQRGFYTDLSLIGSGMLQVMEILLATYEEKTDLNLILLDEPDSHIHRDIQKRLLRFLTESSKNNQIIITTHNESLIRSTKPEYLFHLEGNEKSEYHPIISQRVEGIERGLQPSRQIKILESLGGESSLDLINALEADVLVFVEGKEDAIYIQQMLDNKYNNHKFSNIMYWAFEGIDNLFKEISYYKQIFSLLKNKTSLWEKTILVFDKDLLTSDQRNRLIQELENPIGKIGRTTYIWNTYTIEGTILADMSVFTSLIHFYLKEKHGYQIEMRDLTPLVIQKRDELCEILETRVKEQEDKGALGNEVKRRKKSIQGDKNIPKKEREGLVSEVFIGNEEAYAPKLRVELLQELERKNVAVFAKKDDVEGMICSILANLPDPIELTDNFSTYFLEILQYAKSPNLWFSEWNELIHKIESKIQS